MKFLQFRIGNGLFQILILKFGHFATFRTYHVMMGFIVVPVSYTHLDVYKRQDIGIYLIAILIHTSHVDTTTFAYRFTNIDATVIKLCLLYTSRCV